MVNGGTETEELKKANKKLTTANEALNVANKKLQEEKSITWIVLMVFLPVFAVVSSALIWKYFRLKFSDSSWLDLTAFGGILLTEVLVVGFICIASVRYLGRFD